MNTSLSEEQDLASDDFEEIEVQRATCYCRTCQADLELLGRLKGTETKAMQSLAHNIVFRMLSFFIEVAEVGYNELCFSSELLGSHPSDCHNRFATCLLVEHGSRRLSVES